MNIIDPGEGVGLKSEVRKECRLIKFTKDNFTERLFTEHITLVSLLFV